MTFRSTSIFSLLLLSAATAIGANSIATTPVGCYPVALHAGADTAVGIPLERAASFIGRIESVDGSTLSLAGAADWSSDLYAGAGEEGEYYFCQVVTGELRGATFPILANDAGSITVSPEDEDLSLLLSNLSDETGDTVRIVPYWTPAALFAHTEVPSGACIVIPEEGSAVTVIDYESEAGWTTSGGADGNSLPLRRGRGFFVRLPQGAGDFQLDILGYVPFVPERFVFEGSELPRGKDVFFALSHPEAIALEAAGLEFDDRTVVFAYEDEAQFGGNPSNVYTFYEGYGWFDQRYQPVGEEVVLEPGQAYFVRVPQSAANTQFVWTRTPVYLASL